MTPVTLPEFETYEEATEFWDQLDTAELMGDDGEWFHCYVCFEMCH